MRYQKPLLELPSSCDGWGAGFDLRANCPKGGKVIERHMRFVTWLANWNWWHIHMSLLNLFDRGQCGPFLWSRGEGCLAFQTEALFDLHVCNIRGQSYANLQDTAVLDCLARCWQRRTDFTPLIITTNGVLQRGKQHFLKRLASPLANKWSKKHSTTMSFDLTQLSLTILRVERGLQMTHKWSRISSKKRAKTLRHLHHHQFEWQTDDGVDAENFLLVF